MRRVAVLVALALCACCASAAQSTWLEIKVGYPGSKVGRSDKLWLRGSDCGLSWDNDTPLLQQSTNSWAAVVQCSSSVQVLQVKARFNQNWQIGSNSNLGIPSASGNFTVSIWPWFFQTKGNWGVAVKNMFSPQLNNYRSIIVYTPPSYTENTVRPTYDNVLIMHDGQNLFDPRTSAFGVAWMCQDTLDAMAMQGAVDDVIIVGAYNTANRSNEYTYSYDPTEGFGGDGDIYLDFIEQTLIPWIGSNLRVGTATQNVGILGSSLGGLISCYAGWTRSKVFGKAGCMSSSFWWNSEDFNNGILVKDSSPVPQLTVYVDSGDSGPSQDDKAQTIRVRDHIVQLGYKLNNNLFYYLDKGGQHSEQYWGARFDVPMAALYPVPVLKPQPL